MDFLHFTSEDFLVIGVLFGGIIGGLVTFFTCIEKGWEYGIIPATAVAIIISLFFFGDLNGQSQWENKQKTYHPTGQVETVKYQDGSIEQYAYSNDGERINLTELYGQFFEEGSTYMEINRSGYSWFLFNYDRYVDHELGQKVYHISPPLTSDKE